MVLRIPNVTASPVTHVLQTTSKTSRDGKVVNLIFIPANRRELTDFVAELVLEDCCFNDKMIGIAEIYKLLPSILLSAPTLALRSPMMSLRKALLYVAASKL